MVNQKPKPKVRKSKNVDQVTQYALDVVDGEILAGELLRLACQRHLDDLKKQDTPTFPYFFDKKVLDGLLLFASLVPDPIKGEPLPLMPWQKFVLGSLVAWRNSQTDGKRFRNAIVSMARDNGKTYLASILIAYDFFVQSHKKNNQDIIAASNISAQAGKLYDYARGTIDKLSRTIFKEIENDLSSSQWKIERPSNHNKIIKLSADSNKFDSYHATTAVFDEAGDQITRESFKKISSGMIKNENGLFLMISTAYPNPNAPLREDIKTVTQAIKDGQGKLDDYFLAIWSQDDSDEAFYPETWIKSNPLLGLPEIKDKLAKGLESERNTSMTQGKLNDFLVKNMNIWLNAEQNAAFDLSEVQKSTIDGFDMHDRKVYIGYDASMTSDDTALAFVFPYADKNGVKKWHLYQHSFIPWHKAGNIEAKENQDGINYRDLQDKGFASITQHERGLINNDFVYQWLMEFVDEYNLDVIGFAYDHFHNYAIVKAIEEATTWNMIPVKQGSISLNEPTKWLQDAFVEQKVTHLDDPMMEASLMNAVITSDNNGIKIDKNKATLKIDLVDALIDALYQGIYHFEDFASDVVNDEFSRMSDQQKHDLIMGEDNLF